jgi:hypothetical protein
MKKEKINLKLLSFLTGALIVVNEICSIASKLKRKNVGHILGIPQE